MELKVIFCMVNEAGWNSCFFAAKDVAFVIGFARRKDLNISCECKRKEADLARLNYADGENVAGKW